MSTPCCEPGIEKNRQAGPKLACCEPQAAPIPDLLVRLFSIGGAYTRGRRDGQFGWASRGSDV